MAKWYTGVGSRETPPEIMELMSQLGVKLADQGWILRSGGAEGADSAFEEGWMHHVAFQGTTLAELYIPWTGFNSHYAMSHHGACIIQDDKSPLMQRAFERASTIHPAWERLTPAAKKLHARNVFQVLGRDLNTPSKFLVCWAETDKHGIPKGGTRTAWVLADREGVECFNLINDEHKERIEKWLSSM